MPSSLEANALEAASASSIHVRSSSIGNVLLIARREYLERVRARSFMVMTVLIPAIMGAVLYGLLVVNRNTGSAQHIAVVTADPQFAHDLGAEMADAGGLNTPTVDVYSPAAPGVRAQLDAELKAKGSKLDGYLVATAVRAGERPSFDWVPKVQSDVITRRRVADAARTALTRELLI